MTACPEHLKPYLASLTVRVAIGATSREEAEAAAKTLFEPLDAVRCEERQLFVSGRPFVGNAKGKVQAVALPGGGAKLTAEAPDTTETAEALPDDRQNNEDASKSETA